jgi:DNA-binding transcriptional ArsR family regulator
MSGEKKSKIAESSTAESMTEDTISFSVTLFHALAHPTRLRIVEALTQQPRTVGDVAQMLGLHQSNTSQHLAILSRAGIIKVTPDGAARCYDLRGPRISRILALVNEFRQVHGEALEAAPVILPNE